MSSTRTRTSPADPSGRLATARALATDAACAQVVSAWQARGIDSILLKGPTTAQWLYPDDARGYVDADLMVAPSALMDAAAVLAELDFVPVAEHVSPHAHPWVRETDHAVIDLHVTLWGSTGAPELVWRELQGWLEPHRIGAVTARALDVPGRALHLALHAAQHRDSPARRADLRRALERASIAQWGESERLADRLRALPMMGVGLDLEPAGRELLRRLPLARAGLRAELDNAPLAIGFARVAAADGVLAKASVLAAAIAARGAEGGSRCRGPRAHARRVGWLLTGLPGTFAAARRSRTGR